MRLFVTWSRNIFAILSIISAITVIFIALAADSLGFGGMPGMGPRQVVLVWVGCGLLVTGFYLLSGPGRKFVSELFLVPIPKFDPISILFLASWFGLLTGLVEVTIRGFRRAYKGTHLQQSLHMVWITPLADVFLFLVIGLFIWIFFRKLKEDSLVQVSVLIFSLFGFISIFLHYPIALYAVILLSIGLAVQLSYITKKFKNRFIWLVRRTAPWIIGIISSLAAIMLILNP